MNIPRSAVTYCARTKLLTLVGKKFGVLFKTHPLGSLEIHFLENAIQGGWVLLETIPAIYVDLKLFEKLGDSSIDFDFQAQEFIIRKDP